MCHMLSGGREGKGQAVEWRSVDGWMDGRLCVCVHIWDICVSVCVCTFVVDVAEFIAVCGVWKCVCAFGWLSIE